MRFFAFALSDEGRRNGRQGMVGQLLEQLGTWPLLERRRMTDGLWTAAAIDYSQKH
jgi:hypothetical protein